MTKTTVNNTPRAQPSAHMRWFSEGELLCAWCGRPMPAGYYGKQKHTYLCSPMCIVHHQCRKKKPIRCEHCRKRFVPQVTGRGGRFCCRKHFAAWRRRETDQKKFGSFVDDVHAFIAAVIPEQRVPGSEGDLRCNLAHFTNYLRQRRIRSLAGITPKLISAFFRHLAKIRPRSAGKAMADLRLLFDWTILTGRRSGSNPVNPSLYRQREEKHLPRPLSIRELNQIDFLLEAQGDVRLRLAVALGLESGLQIGEICDLRIEDVHFENQSIRVQRSNRTGLERTALFHVRTKKALEDWLAIRPDVNHCFLLTGHKGIPMRKHVLRSRLIKALRGPGKLKGFSFRRLAQTAAARLAGEMDTMAMMDHFGWQSPGPVEQIRRLPNKAAIAVYVEAMAHIEDDGQALPPRTETLDSFFAER